MSLKASKPTNVGSGTVSHGAVRFAVTVSMTLLSLSVIVPSITTEQSYGLTRKSSVEKNSSPPSM